MACGTWRTGRALVAAVLLALLVAAVPPAVPAAPAVSSTVAWSLPTKQQWKADVRRAMLGSEAWLDQRLAQGAVRPAIVFDVDNTTIATHYAWPRPVKRVLRFATYAANRGVTLLVATGRHAPRLDEARRALRRAGYDIAMLCGRRPGEETQAGKTRCRQEYTELGYTVLAMVGNRPTDCRGGRYFETCIKLPSYHQRLS